MSKNIFSVLANDDSDDEQTPNTVQKQTKKTQRKKDRYLRETYGDKAPKENNQRKTYNQKNSTNDRHSKRGNQAYGGQSRKHGHGKTNVGNEDMKKLENKTTDQANKELNAEMGETAEVVVEPKVEIVTLGTYMSENKQKFGFLSKKPVLEEKKGKGRKKKNLDSLITNTNNIATEVQEKGYGYKKYSNRHQGGRKKRSNLKYDDVNFPSLG